MTGIAGLMLGFGLSIPWLALSGAILFGQSARDGVFGYGLKFEDDFSHTHLGWSGEK